MTNSGTIIWVVYPESIVTWILGPIDNTKTRVILIHSGLHGDTTQYEGGWSYFIERLAFYCNEHSSLLDLGTS
ncbi:hypothetical protein NARC_30205 [Candidatus Nitrosocosmicus arcticus]|uniref:Uncharacterized protein n=1 Tax=Candidatus Nitrosocosmicus arcticus TaxID=2035267 RepID=A0A557SY05_9ARCH|nr:hypothetical protein NARC_30205 [Candidatus Nitrosocosmicus arcticus]